MEKKFHHADSTVAMTNQVLPVLNVCECRPMIIFSVAVLCLSLELICSPTRWHITNSFTLYNITRWCITLLALCPNNALKTASKAHTKARFQICKCRGSGRTFHVMYQRCLGRSVIVWYWICACAGRSSSVMSPAKKSWCRCMPSKQPRTQSSVDTWWVG